MSPSRPKKCARLVGAGDVTAGDGSSSADLVNDAPLLERARGEDGEDGASEESESVDLDIDSPDPVVLERAMNDMQNEEFLEYNSARTGGPVEDSTGENYSPFVICDGKKVDAFLEELDERAGRPNARAIRDHLREKAEKQGHPNPLPGEPPLDASRGAIVYLPGELPIFYNYAGRD